MTTTFENAKIGDKVWDFLSGWGEVIGVCDSSNYPIRVAFLGGEVGTYSTSGKRYKTHNNPTLFWDEIKFEAPTQPPRMKLIHGVEVPDISFKPSLLDWHFCPQASSPLLSSRQKYCGDVYDEFRRRSNLCYPDTEEGRQAAILHAKAMLGIKE